jgi:hypothetical protein
VSAFSIDKIKATLGKTRIRKKAKITAPVSSSVSSST